MKYDMVILSYSKTDRHKEITQQCIDSLLKAKNKIGVNIFVFESYDSGVKYRGAKTIFYQRPEFNYNHSMNYGFTFTNEEFVFFCNNDLVFYDGWADSCYHVFRMGYDSLSPYCPVTHPKYTVAGNFLVEGYQVRFHVAGWCIGVNRNMFKRLGGFNERVEFWYSDNIYAEQLRKEKIKHALVCNSYVKHIDLGGTTLKSLPQKRKDFLTWKQKKIFDNAVKELYNAKKEKALRKHGKAARKRGY